jgi:hypothetical protein
MEGYNFYSERLEGLYEIITYYRCISKHKLCEIFYALAMNVLHKNLKRDNYLFLHEDVYTYKLYYEYTIFSSYLGIHNINDEVIKVLNYSTNDSENNNLLQNLKFYKDVLKQKTRINIDKTIMSIINNEPTKLNSSSSCLIPSLNSEGYKMNIRFVNYYINESGGYLNCDKHIITVNKYVELNKDFSIKTEKWIELKFDNRQYIGIEDIRVFNDVETNKLLFIGTGLHHNNSLGIVTGEYNPESLSLNENEIVPNFSKASCEKNWSFVDYNNSTHIIYSWFPLQICKINNDVVEIGLKIQSVS